MPSTTLSSLFYNAFIGGQLWHRYRDADGLQAVKLLLALIVGMVGMFFFIHYEHSGPAVIPDAKSPEEQIITLHGTELDVLLKHTETRTACGGQVVIRSLFRTPQHPGDPMEYAGVMENKVALNKVGHQILLAHFHLYGPIHSTTGWRLEIARYDGCWWWNELFPDIPYASNIPHEVTVIPGG